MTRNIFSIILIFLVSVRGISQDISISAGSGYERIVSPSHYADPISSGGLGLRESVPVSLGINCTLPGEDLTLVISGMYRSLSGEGTTFMTGQTPSTIISTDIKTKGSVWSASISAKWLLTGSTKGPYLEPALLASSFRIVTTTWLQPPYSFEVSHHRTEYGFAAGGGWAIPFLWDAAIDINARYLMEGLFSSQSGQQGLNSYQLLASIVIPVWASQSQH